MTNVFLHLNSQEAVYKNVHESDWNFSVLSQSQCKQKKQAGVLTSLTCKNHSS